MKQIEIYNVDYVETDASGQYIIGTKNDGIKGIIFVDALHILTIDASGKMVVDITE